MEPCIIKRYCVVGPQVPRDFTSQFDHSLYKLDTTVLPDTIK